MEFKSKDEEIAFYEKELKRLKREKAFSENPEYPNTAKKIINVI